MMSTLKHQVARLPAHVIAGCLALIVSLIVLPTQVLAQQAAPASTEPENEGPSSVRETFKDWTVSCDQVQTGEEGQTERVCQMAQELRRIEGNANQLVLAVNIGAPDTEGKSRFVLTVPFGLFLDKGIKLRVDGGETWDLRYRTCVPTGCLSIQDFDKARVDALRRGNKLSATLGVSETQDAEIEVSLSGFSAASRRLSEVSNQ